MKTLLFVKLGLVPLALFWIGAGFAHPGIGAAIGAALATAVGLWRKSASLDASFAWLCAGVLSAITLAHLAGWELDSLAWSHLGLAAGMAASIVVGRPWTAAFSASAWSAGTRDPLFLSVNSVMSGLWSAVFAYLALARFLLLPQAASTVPLVIAAILSAFLPLALVRHALGSRIRAAQGARWRAPSFARQPARDADVAVVGAGLGGLTAGALLAQAGVRVVVFEQHVVPGGFAHHWLRKGRDGDARPVFRFDSGVHDVSGWWEGAPVYGLFRRLGLVHRIDWRRMSHRFITDGAAFDVPGSWDLYVEQLAARFPTDAAGVRNAMSAIRAIHAAMYSEAPKYSGVPGAPRTVSGMLEFARRYPLAVQWMQRPFAEFLHEQIADPAARRHLLALSGYLTDSPQALTVAAMVPLFGYYLHGGYYPAGGSGRIAHALVEIIERHGGKVRLKTAVERVFVENGRACGVRLAPAEAVRSEAVVLNADLLSATRELVDSARWPEDFRRQVAAMRPSCSAFAVHLGVRGGFEDAKPIMHIAGVTGSAGLVIPSLVDASAAPTGYSTVEILRLASHDAARAWCGEAGAVDDRAHRRSVDYRGKKNAIGDQLIALAEEALPGLSKRIVFRAEATPLTFRRYDWSSDGAIYGATGAPGAIKVKSPIRGLVFAGSATHGAGVEAVMISGANAAEALVPGLLATERDYLEARRPAYGLTPVRNSIATGVPTRPKALRKTPSRYRR